MPDKNVRVRFAPSPTGFLHIGNARTAIFNWLFARKNKGSFILRIEDTDQERSSDEYVDNILTDLRWLNLDWDEGIDTGGKFGPYRQSQRKEIYAEQMQKLLDNGFVYPCFCTSQELEIKRQELLKQKKTAIYDNKCRTLTKQQIDVYLQEGRVPVYRFKVPDKKVVIADMVRGDVVIDTATFGDFILSKSDGFPTFNFAVVVDDGLMQITHVIRGEDHLPNTPKHILLFEALGFKVPKFAHLSMIMGADNAPLSKRHGDTSVKEYRKKGYLPEGLVNYLTLLGWGSDEGEEIFDCERAIKIFELERVNKAAATFDFNKLNWVNSQHIRRSPITRITDLAIPYLKEANLATGNITENENNWLLKVMEVVRPYVDYVSDVPKYAKLFFDQNIQYDQDAIAILKDEGILQLMQILKNKISIQQEEMISIESFKNILKELQAETGIKGKALFQSIRAAITGSLSGPELVDIIPLLKPEILIKRIEQSINL